MTRVCGKEKVRVPYRNRAHDLQNTRHVFFILKVKDFFNNQPNVLLSLSLSVVDDNNSVKEY